MLLLLLLLLLLLQLLLPMLLLLQFGNRDMREFMAAERHEEET